jgi:hypothetical protein
MIESRTSHNPGKGKENRKQKEQNTGETKQSEKQPAKEKEKHHDPPKRREKKRNRVKSTTQDQEQKATQQQRKEKEQKPISNRKTGNKKGRQEKSEQFQDSRIHHTTERVHHRAVPTATAAHLQHVRRAQAQRLGDGAGVARDPRVLGRASVRLARWNVVKKDKYKGKCEDKTEDRIQQNTFEQDRPESRAEQIR